MSDTIQEPTPALLRDSVLAFKATHKHIRMVDAADWLAIAANLKQLKRLLDHVQPIHVETMLSEAAAFSEAAGDAKIGRAVREALHEYGGVNLVYDGDLGTYTAMVVGINDKPSRRTCCRSDLHAAITAKDEGKKCGGECKQLKSFSEFSRNSSSPDGYFSRCKKCENKRVAEYDKKKRGVVDAKKKQRK